MPEPTPLDELKAAIAGGKALLVCGAGVSMAVAGDAAKGWKGLIESAIDEAPKKPGEDWRATCKANLSSKDSDMWLDAADNVQKKFGGFKDPRYRRWLKKSVGKTKRPLIPHCSTQSKLLIAGWRLRITMACCAPIWGSSLRHG